MGMFLGMAEARGASPTRGWMASASSPARHLTQEANMTPLPHDSVESMLTKRRLRSLSRTLLVRLESAPSVVQEREARPIASTTLMPHFRHSQMGIERANRVLCVDQALNQTPGR